MLSISNWVKTNIFGEKFCQYCGVSNLERNYDDHYSYEGYDFRETFWICKSCFKKYAKLNVVYCYQHKSYSYPGGYP